MITAEHLFRLALALMALPLATLCVWAAFACFRILVHLFGVDTGDNTVVPSRRHWRRQ